MTTKTTLGELGLGPDAERVYRALSLRREEGPDRLSAGLGMRRQEFDRVLAVLHEHGFVTGDLPGSLPGAAPDPSAADPSAADPSAADPSAPEPAVAEAGDPAAAASGPGGSGGSGGPGGTLPRPVPAGPAIRALAHRRTAELHRRAAELERIRLAADEIAVRLTPDGAAGRSDGAGWETVAGRQRIVDRVAELLAGARHEVAFLDRPPYAMPARPEEYLPGHGLDGLLARGVAVRIVVGEEALDRPGRWEVLAPLMASGVRIRAAAHVPTKLLVVDGRTALLPPTGEADPTSSALQVSEGLLAPAMVGLFEAVWQGALPFGGPEGGAEPDSERRRALLGLMAGGLKDEAIARQLGVHVHTARRRINALLGELGATTRFQAGARAALRGWL
ncbi:hypothetical protein [Streptomyces sp. NPDC097619]|uniref:hypothetical protein n=1 Tax=Streptomyces sp. NPDC097619 TaxID=3157228 RepID=UPI003321E463